MPKLYRAISCCTQRKQHYQKARHPEWVGGWDRQEDESPRSGSLSLYVYLSLLTGDLFFLADSMWGWLPASVCNITVCTHFIIFSITPALRVISLWGIQSVPKSTGGAAVVPTSLVVGSICSSVFFAIRCFSSMSLIEFGPCVLLKCQTGPPRLPTAPLHVFFFARGREQESQHAQWFQPPPAALVL